MHLTKFPSHIKIGHIPVGVTLIKEVQSGEAWGEYSARDYHINLQWDMPLPGKTLEVVLHEIGHAIWHIAGIREKEWTEEQTVGALGTWWAMVYRDNPALVTWIADTAKKK
jgi:hypothetical protein